MDKIRSQDPAEVTSDNFGYSLNNLGNSLTMFSSPINFHKV